MRLYLVRHPKPLVDSGVCYGQTDVACAPNVLQTAALALRDTLLRTLPKGLDIISSPLSRCEQLPLILQGLEPDLTYKTDARLAEMHFGAWEMQRWDAIAPAELQAWTDDFADYRCGGSGESSAQLVQRVVQRLLDSARAGKDQIWITHAGVMRALQWLHVQPLQAVSQIIAHPPGREPSFPWSARLQARDWPQGDLAFGQVLTWRWPKAWPLD